MKSMPRINLLAPRLANQIAAGEVIERPASIIKELMENSIDAGATKIQVDIDNGGMSRIVVSDNGHGMVKEDLTLSLSRHATSKIQTSDDLQCIQSLGFRGEALASICSVSNMIIASRTQDCDLGWQVRAEGPDQKTCIEPVAQEVGTTVVVRDLFFNLPARRKFLRSDKTEFLHIDAIVKKIALSQMGVAISLSHNGRSVLQIPAVSSIKELSIRARAVCGSTFVDNAVAIDVNDSGMHFYGLVGSPDHTSSNTDGQYSFVNGRVVRDKLISHAIRQGYDETIYPGRYPCYVLFLEIDASVIDVNVHPAKTEVRFRSPGPLHDFICYQLRAAIGLCELAPEFTSQDLSLETIEELVPSPVAVKSSWQIHTVIDNRFAIVENKRTTYLFDIHVFLREAMQRVKDCESKRCLFPVSTPMAGEIQPDALAQLEQLGFQFAINDKLVLKQIPSVMEYADQTALCLHLQAVLTSNEIFNVATLPIDPETIWKKPQLSALMVNLNPQSSQALTSLEIKLLEKIAAFS